MNPNYINWNIDPEIFNIFGISLRYYGLLFVSGLILCYLLLKWIFRRENIPKGNLDKLTVYTVLGVFIGARLGHCLFYEPAYFLSNPVEMFLPVRILPQGGFEFTGYQGLASHGGVLGMLIALILYYFRTGQSLVNTLDFIALAAPLQGFFIRTANLMNSEIIGMPSDMPWAFVFRRVNNIPRHPAQLYEALIYLLIFIIMISLYFKKWNKFGKGAFTGICLILVFTARFFIEFIKENQVSFENSMFLNMGQLLSIPFIILGIILIIYGFKNQKKIIV